MVTGVQWQMSVVFSRVVGDRCLGFGQWSQVSSGWCLGWGGKTRVRGDRCLVYGEGGDDEELLSGDWWLVAIVRRLVADEGRQVCEGL